MFLKQMRSVTLEVPGKPTHFCANNFNKVPAFNLRNEECQKKLNTHSKRKHSSQNVHELT